VRILYLSDIRFPIERANGMQSMETAHALVRRGHVVTFGVRPDIVRPARDPFVFYGLPRDARLRIARAPILGPHRLRRVEFLAWAAARVLAARGADLVFTRDLGVADLVRRLPRRPPLVYESHGYAPVFAETLPDLVSGASAATSAKLRRLTARERAVWHAADGYVATTAVLAADMAARFGARPRVAVVPNGTRLPGTAPAIAPGTRGDAPVAAYAGHLYPWKGVDVFLEALGRLPHARGLVFGGHEGDADMTRVTALAGRLGLSGRVTFGGFVPRAELPDRLAAADVFVLPTLDTPSARYTCPLKMFEYMAAGRPIVSSDLPPIRDVLVHDVNAMLVPPGDAVALAAAVDALAGDPARAARLAQRAQSDVEQYSWDRRAERLDDLFSQVLSLTPPQGLTSI
jgi:glycosyltransferase involved in cell wall biosynthesis